MENQNGNEEKDKVQGLSEEANVQDVPPKKKKRGRPKKKDILAKTDGKRKQVGRPKGDAAAIAEFKARILNSPKSRKVLDTILDAALDGDHKNQSAAWKLLMDRMLPLSYFDKDKNNGGRSAVNITISGIGGETTIVGGEEPQTNNEDIEDAEYFNVETLDTEK